jgi:hypothetical protein
MTVQPAERAKLSDLLDQFMAGGMCTSEFARQVARFIEPLDPGVAAISAVCWDVDNGDIRLYWRTWRKLAVEQRACIERCRRFLATALPYEWPDAPNLLLADIGQAVLTLLGMVALGNILFGLALVLLLGLWLIGLAHMVVFGIVLAAAIIGSRSLRQWTTEVRQSYEAAGDKEVWPFLRRSDYAKHTDADRDATRSAI